MPTLLRIPAVLARRGTKRTMLYEDIDRGLMTKPVRIGARAVAFPEHEVEAVTAARIAGASEADIRKLVIKLHEQRGSAMPPQREERP